MHDPLSFLRNPPWLQFYAQQLADFLNLPTLPLHAHELVLAFAIYQVTLTHVSPLLSSLFFAQTYKSLNPRTKFNWDVHVVSLVQSCLVVGIALYVTIMDEERAAMDWKLRVWGYDGATGLVQAFVVGYFVWDLWMCTRHFKMFGLGMLLHCLSALTVFSFGFRPFTNYYATNFILYEISSPFLNIHWFCDKLNMTGSPLQLVNGIILLTTFILARLFWGTYSSALCFYDLFRAMQLRDTHPKAAPLQPIIPLTADRASEAKELLRFAPATPDAPTWICVAYLVCNVTMNSLNWYWCTKMIAALRKRFDPPLGTRKRHEKEVDGMKAGGAGDGKAVKATGRRSSIPEVVKRTMRGEATGKESGEEISDDTETEAAMLS